MTFYRRVLGTRKGPSRGVCLPRKGRAKCLSATERAEPRCLSARPTYRAVHTVPFIRRELLRVLFCTRNCRKWVQNQLLNFSVRAIVDHIASVPAQYSTTHYLTNSSHTRVFHKHTKLAIMALLST